MPFFKPERNEMTEEQMAEALLDSFVEYFSSNKTTDQETKNLHISETIKRFCLEHPDIDKKSFQYKLADVFSIKAINKLNDSSFEDLNSAFDSLL